MARTRTAGGILLMALFVAGTAGAHELRVVTPRDGAVLPPGKAMVIGVARGGKESRVDIEVNGKTRPPAEIRNGVFQTTVPLSAGRNILKFSVGDAEKKTTVVVSDKASFAYHGEIEKCRECHGEARDGHAIPRPSDALCYKCHDRVDKGRLIHGPVASGDCTSCHEPHASGHPKMTVASPETLCVSCHDQKSSEAHFRKSKGKSCTSCHDPHSANKEFLQR